MLLSEKLSVVQNFEKKSMVSSLKQEEHDTNQEKSLNPCLLMLLENMIRTFFLVIEQDTNKYYDE